MQHALEFNQLLPNPLNLKEYILSTETSMKLIYYEKKRVLLVIKRRAKIVFRH